MDGPLEYLFISSKQRYVSPKLTHCQEPTICAKVMQSKHRFEYAYIPNLLIMLSLLHSWRSDQTPRIYYVKNTIELLTLF